MANYYTIMLVDNKNRLTRHVFDAESEYHAALKSINLYFTGYLIRHNHTAVTETFWNDLYDINKATSDNISTKRAAVEYYINLANGFCKSDSYKIKKIYHIGTQLSDNFSS